MSGNHDNIELTFLNEINGGEMNARISCQKLELWEQTQSSPTIDSTMQGYLASQIHAEKIVRAKKILDIYSFLYYIENEALNLLREIVAIKIMLKG